MLEPGLEAGAFEALSELHQAVVKILDADPDTAQQVASPLYLDTPCLLLHALHATRHARNPHTHTRTLATLLTH